MGIYGALLLQFSNAVKPLLVLAAVPYGVVGALLALAIMGTPFGFMAFLGVASLIGVIVSHVIVLFDFIEEMHEKGEPLEQALRDAGIQRLRPVLITVGATILALFPLAIEGGPLWKPLCYAQIGGLAVATFITLLLVPVFYSIAVLDLKIVKWDPRKGTNSPVDTDNRSVWATGKFERLRAFRTNYRPRRREPTRSCVRLQRNGSGKSSANASSTPPILSDKFAAAAVKRHLGNACGVNPVIEESTQRFVRLVFRHESGGHFAEVFVGNELVLKFVQQPLCKPWKPSSPSRMRSICKNPRALFVDDDMPGDDAVVIQQAVAKIDWAGGFQRHAFSTASKSWPITF